MDTSQIDYIVKYFFFILTMDNLIIYVAMFTYQLNTNYILEAIQIIHVVYTINHFEDKSLIQATS